jgi:hypothetical protein
VTPAQPLADGTYTAQAEQSDSPGNAGVSTPSTFAVDTVAPTVTLASPTNAGATNNNKPTFSGAAGTAIRDSPSITVKIYNGSTASGIPMRTLTATAAKGTWSVAPAQPLADGTYTAEADQSDSAGNAGVSTPSTFTVDTVPPAVTLTTPADGGGFACEPWIFSGAAGTASGDLPTITVKIYRGSTTSGPPVQTLTAIASGGSWSLRSLPVDGSSNTYTAQAQQSDAVGNTGTSSANTFRLFVCPT